MSLITLVLLPAIAAIGVAVLVTEFYARKTQPAPVRVKTNSHKTRK